MISPLEGTKVPAKSILVPWEVLEEWIILRTLVSLGKGDRHTKTRLDKLDNIIKEGNHK